jgi:ribosome-associated heat shock protein Hsp15
LVFLDRVSNETRIDKWLWATRLFKTRSLAAKACRDGDALIAGQRVKPARDLRAGDIVTVKVAGVQRTVKVLGFPSRRVGAKSVPEFMEDLTPPAEYTKARETAAQAPQFAWSKGLGRPTKKNRRLWQRSMDENL